MSVVSNAIKSESSQALVHLSQLWLRAFRWAKVLSCVPSVWIASQTECLRSTTQTPMGKRNLRIPAAEKPKQMTLTTFTFYPSCFQKNIMFPISSKYFWVLAFTACFFVKEKWRVMHNDIYESANFLSRSNAKFKCLSKLIRCCIWR